jgi:hypothetical protein
MKKILTSFIIITSLFLVLVSCSKDKTNVPGMEGLYYGPVTVLVQGQPELTTNTQFAIIETNDMSMLSISLTFPSLATPIQAGFEIKNKYTLRNTTISSGSTSFQITGYGFTVPSTNLSAPGNVSFTLSGSNLYTIGGTQLHGIQGKIGKDASTTFLLNLSGSMIEQSSAKSVFISISGTKI